jgi:hypothetical protein
MTTGSGGGGGGGGGSAVAIDMNKLKESFDSDPLSFHLTSRILLCKKRREAFWEHYSKMRWRNNLIGIPLLILSSGTGVSSVAQIHSPSQWLIILTTVLGVLSAFVTSLQRYMQYSERAEKARYLAKNYGRIATKIEDFIIFIESGSTKVEEESFNNFIKEMHKDIETLTQEADDMPATLRSSPEAYDDKLAALSDIELNIVRATVNKSQGKSRGKDQRKGRGKDDGMIEAGGEAGGEVGEVGEVGRDAPRNVSDDYALEDAIHARNIDIALRNMPRTPCDADIYVSRIPKARSRSRYRSRSRSLDSSPQRSPPSPSPAPLPHFPRNAVMARRLAGSAHEPVSQPRRQTPPRRVRNSWK